MRRLGAVLVGLGAVYVLLVGALALAMRQPPAVFGRIMKHMPGPMFLLLPFEPLWMWARAGNLKTGDLAPGFTLQTPDRKSSGGLEEHRGIRPVVLVFGSYT
ncbi:MAG TPA: hypothetical protein VHA11_08955 [Bryobacteraceae bacterium]|nr:hypothetical protein [Bryobacteraceae bacterium]